MAEFDYSEAISEARAKYESISKALDVDRLTAEAKDLEVKAAEPGLWDDPENAQKVTSKLSAVQSQLKRLASADQRIEDVETLVELGQEEEDADTLAEAKAEVESIQKDLDDMEIQTLLDGEYDERSAVVTIRSGAGGVDAADFAQMLLRMYLRWAERNGYKAKVMDTSYAEEAGIKSATFQVDAPYAYGRLSVEGGTHRLVRISPVRQPGPPSDQLRRRGSGAAGRSDRSHRRAGFRNPRRHLLLVRSWRTGREHHVSAVRITHIPTGIVVTMQDERSQIQNRAAAMAVLQSRLLVLRHEEEAKKKKELAGDIKASWGDQMRSYVLHPYQMVKDLRTGYETSQTQAVFDGDIDEFIEAGIRWRHEQRRAAAEEQEA